MIDIYKASAGSGKTFTLTKRYIYLLLTDESDDGSGTLRLTREGTRGRHRHILAITFTNKATDEMKQRIIHELAVLAGVEQGWSEPSPYLNDLIKDTGATADEIAVRARTALFDLLRDFGYFNVSTIDSFFQSVLRTFAREAEIPGNYELDLDIDTSTRLGVEETLQSINRDTGDPASIRRLESWLIAYMRQLMSEGTGFNLFNRNTKVFATIVELVSKLSDETFMIHREAVREYLADPSRLERLTRALNERLGAVADEARATCSAALDLDGLKESYRKYLSEWAAEGYVAKEKVPAWMTKGVDDPGTAFVSKAKPGQAALTTVQTAISTALTSLTTTPLLRRMIKNLYILGLIETIDNHIAQYRAETSTLLLSDTNTLLQQIIGDDNTPFIYERTGLWLHNFLIDEFQDTSRMQWQNLTPLIEESLSTGKRSLVIGDEKQSIYRFRNSDPTLLQNLHRQFTGRSTVSGATVAENTNWRSAPEIVKFNNTLFRALADRDELTSTIYSGVTQQVAKKNINLPGYVALEPYEGDDPATARNNAFDHTITNMLRQLNAGYRPCEIAALFNITSDARKFIEFFLERQQTIPDFPPVKIMSDEALLVSRSPAVKLVLSVLRVIAAKGDAGNDRGGYTDRECAELIHRFEVCRSRGDSPDVALDCALHRPDEVDSIDASEFGGIDTTNLVTLVEKVISRHVSPGMRRDEAAYLTALCDMTIEATQTGVTDVDSFLRWWDDKGCKTAVPAAADSDAIVVMTAHKSKGLEFKCVHIPFNDSGTRRDSIKWFEPRGLDFVAPDDIPPLIPLPPGKYLLDTPYRDQMQKLDDDSRIDALNLAYVALTRAERELIVNWAPEAKNGLSGLIAEGIFAAGAPGFYQRIHASIPADMADPYVELTLDDDGRLTIGHPTTPAEHKESRTMLTPSHTVAMPAANPVFAPALWQNLRLEDDSEAPDPTIVEAGAFTFRRDLVAQAITSLRSAGDIERTVSQLAASGRITANEREAFATLLTERISGPATARWFTDVRRSFHGRKIYMGKGRTALADLIVWPGDGTGTEIVVFERDTPQAAEASAAFIGRRMRYAGYGSVKAFTWNLADGRVNHIAL